MLEGRIREVETTLKTATLMDKKQPSLRVCIGDSIILVDLESSEELHYMIVGPRETAPSKGKISGVSPVGKAVVGRSEGDTVQVSVPAGKLRYQIKHIKR
jgi:transcription elongation factor GreA